MQFEWDHNKRDATIRKHGVDFADMTKVFDGRPTFTYRSAFGDEERWATVAELDGRFYIVVWTPRQRRRRIISAYRADDWEIREYRRLHG
jgi:hypothetical protein